MMTARAAHARVHEDAEEPLRAATARALRGSPGSVLWPRASREIPDDSMLFRVAYLGPEWAAMVGDERAARLDALHRYWGHTRRQYRNALAFALPDAEAVARFREGGAGREAPFGVYKTLMLPREGQGHLGATEFEAIPIGKIRAGEGLHEAAMRALAPRMREEIAPAELARIVGLGETDCAGVRRALFPMADAARWLFCFLNLPRLRDDEPVRRAVIRGVREGEFGLLRGQDLAPLDSGKESWKGAALFRAKLRPEQVRFESGDYLVWRGALE